MNSLDSRIATLYTLTHEPLYLGFDGGPIYSDHSNRLSSDVLSHANTLYPHHGSTGEEGARLCFPLLMGYNATIYNGGDKEVRVQQILNRCQEMLDRLSAPLLKVQLLTYCYSEVFDDDFSREAHSTIDSWGERTLFGGECEIAEQLRSLEESPYSNWEAEG